MNNSIAFNNCFGLAKYSTILVMVTGTINLFLTSVGIPLEFFLKAKCWLLVWDGKLLHVKKELTWFYLYTRFFFYCKFLLNFLKLFFSSHQVMRGFFSLSLMIIYINRSPNSQPSWHFQEGREWLHQDIFLYFEVCVKHSIPIVKWRLACILQQAITINQYVGQESEHCSIAEGSMFPFLVTNSPLSFWR